MMMLAYIERRMTKGERAHMNEQPIQRTQHNKTKTKTLRHYFIYIFFCFF